MTWPEQFVHNALAVPSPINFKPSCYYIVHFTWFLRLPRRFGISCVSRWCVIGRQYYKMFSSSNPSPTCMVVRKDLILQTIVIHRPIVIGLSIVSCFPTVVTPPGYLLSVWLQYNQGSFLFKYSYIIHFPPRLYSWTESYV